MRQCAGARWTQKAKDRRQWQEVREAHTQQWSPQHCSQKVSLRLDGYLHGNCILGQFFLELVSCEMGPAELY